MLHRTLQDSYGISFANGRRKIRARSNPSILFVKEIVFVATTGSTSDLLRVLSDFTKFLILAPYVFLSVKALHLS